MNEILEKDEKVLWEGKPNAASYFTKMIIPSIFGIIFFTIFITFFVSIAFTVFNGFSSFSNFDKNFETPTINIVFDENGNQIVTQDGIIGSELKEEMNPFNFITNNYKTVITYVSIFVVLMFIISLVARIIEFNNLKYFVTDKRVIIQKGIIGQEYRVIEYTKMDDLYVKIGLINKLFNTGTVILLVENVTTSSNNQTTTYRKIDLSNSFMSINTPYDVFNKIKEVSQDIRTDMYYPNELRPEENKGYNTEYKPEDEKK